MLPDHSTILRFRRKAATSIPAGIHLMAESDDLYDTVLLVIIPRLLHVESLGISAGVPILLSKGLPQRSRAAIDRFNVAQRTVIELDRTYSYPVDRLLYPSEEVHPQRSPDPDGGNQITPCIQELLSARRRLPAAVPARKGEKRRRLYVRPGSRFPPLSNEGLLQETVLDYGFEIVAVEDLTFGVQVRLFAEAEAVLVPLGEDVANLAWCDRGTLAYVLMPEQVDHRSHSWYAMRQLTTLDLRVLPLAVDWESPGSVVAGPSYAVRLDDLRAELQTLTTRERA